MSVMVRAAVLAVGVALVAAGSALGNGETQREIRGRVVSVDPGAGTVVVERAFRDRTVRLALQVAPGAPVFACGDERAALDRLGAGMAVTVFYEALGAEGVANLVVVERAP